MVTTPCHQKQINAFTVWQGKVQNRLTNVIDFSAAGFKLTRGLALHQAKVCHWAATCLQSEKNRADKMKYKTKAPTISIAMQYIIQCTGKQPLLIWRFRVNSTMWTPEGQLLVHVGQPSSESMIIMDSFSRPTRVETSAELEENLVWQCGASKFSWQASRFHWSIAQMGKCGWNFHGLFYCLLFYCCFTTMVTYRSEAVGCWEVMGFQGNLDHPPAETVEEIMREGQEKLPLWTRYRGSHMEVTWLSCITDNIR